MIIPVLSNFIILELSNAFDAVVLLVAVILDDFDMDTDLGWK